MRKFIKLTIILKKSKAMLKMMDSQVVEKASV
jgi:hypothetical protein